MFFRSALAAVVGVLFSAPGAPGGDPGDSLSKSLSEPGFVLVGTDLGSISSIASAGDSRLFLALRSGRILIWDEKGALPRPFLNISSLISTSAGRGLYSVAFHPKYEKNGLLFVGYANASGNLVVARYKRSAADRDRADPASAAILLTIPVPSAADHTGGALQFGPDGYLYIAVGDGGTGGEYSCNAQRDDVLLGKILRLDVNVNRRKAPYYGIPASNPFARAGAPLDKVWAKGFRHPRRFSFDRATGDLYIGEVGQTAREEIDFQARASKGGENYGWGVMEGTLCARANSGCPDGLPACKSPALQKPIFEYTHEGGDCSVVGGYVYRGTHIAGLSGIYFYGDSCTGRIWGDLRPMAETVPGLSTFGEDESGELYLGTETGALYRMVRAREAVRYEATVREPSDSAPAEPAPEEMPPPAPIAEPAAAPPPPPPAQPVYTVIGEPVYGARPMSGHSPHAGVPEPKPTSPAAPTPAPTIAPPPPTPSPREVERIPPTAFPREQPSPRPVNPRQ